MFALPESEIVRRYRSGETLMEIGRSLGVSHGVIRYCLVRAGVPRRHRGGYRPRVDFSIPFEEVVGRYRAGISVRELAPRVGVSESTLERRLREAGILMGRGGPGRSRKRKGGD